MKAIPTTFWITQIFYKNIWHLAKMNVEIQKIHILRVTLELIFKGLSKMFRVLTAFVFFDLLLHKSLDNETFKE